MSGHEHDASFKCKWICTVLSCSLDEYLNLLDDDSVRTETIVHDVLKSVINPNESLRASNSIYPMDDLLRGMVIHAPHPHGRRYAAVALHIASGRGPDTIVNSANAWLKHLLLPSLSSISCIPLQLIICLVLISARTIQPSSSQMHTFGATE